MIFSTARDMERVAARAWDINEMVLKKQFDQRSANSVVGALRVIVSVAKHQLSRDQFRSEVQRKKPGRKRLPRAK